MGRVFCSQIVGQINIDEAPCLADLGARHSAGFGTGLQGVRMNAEEFGGFVKV
jgi:hypothetical protein